MIKDQLQIVLAKIEAACQRYGRPAHSVQLLPVSKTFPVSAIQEAMQAGLHRFAENRAQELKEKAIALQDEGLQWVLIGHLQTNKAKEVARYACEIQSLDRLELAVALDKRLQQEGRVLDALIQVKTSTEDTKTGMPVEEVLTFLQQVKSIDTLKIKGFMTIAENTQEESVVRHCFKQLAMVAEQARQATGLALPELSMGMSADFEWAIAEGATQVRLGSAIFGQRTYTPAE